MIDANNNTFILLLGALVVLASLILLVGLTALRKASAKPAAAQVLEYMPVTAAQSVTEDYPDAGLVAAITAAISCVLTQETPAQAPGGFIVRRIRRA